MRAQDLVNRIGTIESLDKVAKPLQSFVKKLTPQGPVKDLLSGTWLGHQLHPMLTDIPIGSFTSATLLDLLGGPRAQPAANALAAIGALSVIPTAAAGLADWSDSEGDDQRLGVVHAAANVVGVAFYTASIVARRRGQRGTATALGLVGMGVMSVGGYLGGHLTLVRGVGVNQTAGEQPPSKWKVAIADEDLADDTLQKVEVSGIDVLVRRSGDTINALSNRCTHAGGPLDEGETAESKGRTCVVCPWHQSTFRLDDGHVVHGPATVDQPAYDTRNHAGNIEVRPR